MGFSEVTAFGSGKSTTPGAVDRVMDLESAMNKELIAAGNDYKKTQEIMKRYGKLLSELAKEMAGTDKAVEQPTILGEKDAKITLEYAEMLKHRHELPEVDRATCLVCGKDCPSGTIVMISNDGSGNAICQDCFAEASVKKGQQSIAVVF